MVAATIAEMVGKAVTLTSLGGLKRKRDKVEDIMGRLKRFCGTQSLSMTMVLAARPSLRRRLP